MRESFRVIQGGAPDERPARPLEADVPRALEGDPGATERLWSASRDFLTRIGLAMGVRVEDLPDVIQDTLFSAHENLRRFDPARGRFEAWLGTIFVRRARNLHRGQSRFRALLARFAAGRASRGSPPDQESQESRWTLERLLEALTPRERRVVALYEIAGLSAEECGRILDVSPAGVRSLARHARNKLSRAAEALTPRGGRS